MTQDWSGPGSGHYLSWTQINAGGPKRGHYASPLRPLLKSGLQPLGRYGTYQETIGMRHEQMYTLSDTRLEWLGEASLFESNSDKRWGANTGPLFESPPG